MYICTSLSLYIYIYIYIYIYYQDLPGAECLGGVPLPWGLLFTSEQQEPDQGLAGKRQTLAEEQANKNVCMYMYI